LINQQLTTEMADDELAAIRAARLKELQQQPGQVPVLRVSSLTA
jgi:hypothetical protein